MLSLTNLVQGNSQHNSLQFIRFLPAPSSCCYSSLLLSPSSSSVSLKETSSFPLSLNDPRNSPLVTQTFPSPSSSPSSSCDSSRSLSCCSSSSSTCGCSGRHEEENTAVDISSSTEKSRNKSYWEVSLDKDLLQTIIDYYPEWFVMAEDGLTRITPLNASTNNNVMMATSTGAPDTSVGEVTGGEPMASNMGSPRAVVDEASIQSAMDKIKESLKVKLLLRRPISQLVEQGILPPVKASPGFYEQSKKLERARMEDYLKHKIQRRPDRQSLIEQHILEDTSISPSLQDAQRQLKRAKLADDLNDRLSHRPGPLELVKGNILVADERLAQAIKEGALQFKATSEGEPVKHPPPLFYFSTDLSSSSSASPSNESSSDGTLSSPPPTTSTQHQLLQQFQQQQQQQQQLQPPLPPPPYHQHHQVVRGGDSNNNSNTFMLATTTPTVASDFNAASSPVVSSSSLASGGGSVTTFTPIEATLVCPAGQTVSPGTGIPSVFQLQFVSNNSLVLYSPALNTTVKASCLTPSSVTSSPSTTFASSSTNNVVCSTTSNQFPSSLPASFNLNPNEGGATFCFTPAFGPTIQATSSSSVNSNHQQDQQQVNLQENNKLTNFSVGTVVSGASIVGSVSQSNSVTSSAPNWSLPSLSSNPLPISASYLPSLNPVSSGQINAKNNGNINQDNNNNHATDSSLNGIPAGINFTSGPFCFAPNFGPHHHQQQQKPSQQQTDQQSHVAVTSTGTGISITGPLLSNNATSSSVVVPNNPFPSTFILTPSPDQTAVTSFKSVSFNTGSSSSSKNDSNGNNNNNMTTNSCSSSSSPSPSSSIAPVSSPSSSSVSTSGRSESSSNASNKNRKKSKSKVQPKSRTIKFHEYKGPPNAQKNANGSNNTNINAPNGTESSYELLLKQQQLFLQWQLEWKAKYPNMTLPTSLTGPQTQIVAQQSVQQVVQPQLQVPKQEISLETNSQPTPQLISPPVIVHAQAPPPPVVVVSSSVVTQSTTDSKPAKKTMNRKKSAPAIVTKSESSLDSPVNGTEKKPRKKPVRRKANSVSTGCSNNTNNHNSNNNNKGNSKTKGKASPVVPVEATPAPPEQSGQNPGGQSLDLDKILNDIISWMDNSSDWKAGDLSTNVNNNHDSLMMSSCLTNDSLPNSSSLLEDHYSSCADNNDPDFSDILCNICPGVCLCNINHCIQPALVYDSGVGDCSSVGRF